MFEMLNNYKMMDKVYQMYVVCMYVWMNVCVYNCIYYITYYVSISYI